MEGQLVKRIERNLFVSNISIAESAAGDKVESWCIFAEVTKEIYGIGAILDIVKDEKGLPRSDVATVKGGQHSEHFGHFGLVAEDGLEYGLVKETEAGKLDVFGFSELLDYISFSYHRSTGEKERMVASVTLPLKQLLINISLHKAISFQSAIYTFLGILQEILHFL